MADAAPQENEESTTTAGPGDAAPGGSSDPTPVQGTQASAKVELGSLAPRFVKQQHGTYLRRLEEAARNPKNLNIAVTGRYGAGKSSVLDEFESKQAGKTLRLAISTLAPNDDGVTLTNRIQKELVKQLVYSASPRTLRHSRFSRSVPLSRQRAVGEAAAAVALLALFLKLMNWLPSVSGTSPDHPWSVRVLAWAALAAVLVTVGAFVRLATYDRFVLSNVSAAGATVTLSERTPTYFDEYLDDIVHYFDTEDIDIVVFEDLDRFDDPHIFEALRELNTLLNNTNKRIDKGAPLRFVYAVRDSLFEKLGADTVAAGDDAAAAETLRANRTKFFDVVIPLVPFISHRNARELLTDLLEEAGIHSIDRHLINLVAQHTTDMRLLRNIRNEYLVFAERLLESDKVAPGLTPSHLFALVVYKNFHLEDFEKIARRSSDLDTLYRYQREFVRTSVAAREARKRNLLAGRGRTRSRAPLAKALGERLELLAESLKAQSGYAGWPHIYYSVSDTTFTIEKRSTYTFWAAVAAAETVEAYIAPSAGSSGQRFLVLGRDQLMMLVPEALDARRWQGIDDAALRSDLAAIDRDIDFLRGAGFADLTARNDIKLAVFDPTPAPDQGGAPDAPAASPNERTFAELVAATMKSELARDLVKRGYLDRNFALYAAQFYGHFTGVDVATFIVQSVQTNTMDIDYRFTSEGAVANLLDEANAEFTNTAAAYNIAVLDYLLETNHPGASDVVARMVTDFDDDAATFLAAYLTSGAWRDKLAARLAAAPWRAVFNYLVTNDDVPDDVRPALVDAALQAAQVAHTYDFDTEVGDFIGDHFQQMQAFTHTHHDATTRAVVEMLDRSDILLADIEPLSAAIRAVVVEKHLYEITADNLRTALAVTGEVTLDRVRDDSKVYDYCLTNPNGYLTTVSADADTSNTISKPETLAVVLNDIAGQSANWVEHWGEAEITRLMTDTSPSAILRQLRTVPTSTWAGLADANLFAASLQNIDDYRSAVGDIDDHLAALLVAAGAIDTSGDDEVTELAKAATAVAILNANTIEDPADRVALVQSLMVNDPLPIEQITPTPDALLARLIQRGIVPDDAASFQHFHDAGWSAIGPAIAASRNVGTFLEPDLVEGMVSDLLKDEESRDKVGRQVVEALDDYVPDDDGPALTAAAQYAARHHINLSPANVHRIAAAGGAERGLVLRLLRNANPAPGAQDIIAVFEELGGPYNEIARPGATLQLPNDDLHHALLQILAAGGRCTFHKTRLQQRYTVRPQ